MNLLKILDPRSSGMPLTAMQLGAALSIRCLNLRSNGYDRLRDALILCCRDENGRYGVYLVSRWISEWFYSCPNLLFAIL